MGAHIRMFNRHSHHLEIGLLGQHSGQSFPDNRMIVYDGMRIVSIMTQLEKATAPLH